MCAEMGRFAPNLDVHGYSRFTHTARKHPGTPPVFIITDISTAAQTPNQRAAQQGVAPTKPHPKVPFINPHKCGASPPVMCDEGVGSQVNQRRSLALQALCRSLSLDGLILITGWDGCYNLESKVGISTARQCMHSLCAHTTRSSRGTSAAVACGCRVVCTLCVPAIAMHGTTPLHHLLLLYTH